MSQEENAVVELALAPPQCRAGRKQKEDSRADELRERLVKWSYFPADKRPSLRKLAEALNTSHQLLSHLLVGLEEWERKQDMARCRAITKPRGIVWSEAQQIKVHLKLRESRRQQSRSYSPAREARTEGLINAMYTKFRLKHPPPKHPMAMWIKPPEGLETWRMLWPE